MLPCRSCHCFVQYPLRTASAPPPPEAEFSCFSVMNGSTSESCCSETKPKDHYSAVTSSKLFSLCSHYLLTKPNLLRKASCVNLCVMTLGKEGWIPALPQALCRGSSAPTGTLLGHGLSEMYQPVIYSAFILEEFREIMETAMDCFSPIPLILFLTTPGIQCQSHVFPEKWF